MERREWLGNCLGMGLGMFRMPNSKDPFQNIMQSVLAASLSIITTSTVHSAQITPLFIADRVINEAFMDRLSAEENKLSGHQKTDASIHS